MWNRVGGCFSYFKQECLKQEKPLISRAVLSRNLNQLYNLKLIFTQMAHTERGFIPYDHFKQQNNM